MHNGIKKVESITNGKEIPSIPTANFKLSLLNQLKEFTNWKWGIFGSKLIGIYSEMRKLIIEVHKADIFAVLELLTSTEKRTKKIPIIGIIKRIGTIGKLNIN